MLEDVADGYVTVERAALDYGVVVEEVDVELAEYRVDADATEKLRAEQRQSARAPGSTRTPRTWRARFRDGDLDVLDLVRHYGVILDWGSGEVLPRTTKQYRELLQRRSASAWEEEGA